MGAAAALVVAQAAFVVAAGGPSLKAEVAATLGVLLVCAVVVSGAALEGRALWGALAVAAGAVVALSAAGAEAGATPAEALAWGLAGVAFATLLGTPALAVALPLFVGGVDLAAWLAGAAEPSALTPAPGDPLALVLPGWGDTAPAGRLGAPDAVFLGAFAASARRLGLRAAATTGAMAAGLVAAVLLAPAPALALMAAGVLLPNLDRLSPLLLRAR